MQLGVNVHYPTTAYTETIQDQFFHMILTATSITGTSASTAGYYYYYYNIKVIHHVLMKALIRCFRNCFDPEMAGDNMLH